ncbi:MAG: C40 family peptidase [Coriobacteriales bacterium]|nr:C40 family peptidase [Coriobacteriales bacterium]
MRLRTALIACAATIALVSAPMSTATRAAGLTLSGATRVQQDARGLAWTGFWSHQGSASASGDSRAYSRTSGSSVTFAFTGTAVSVVAERGPKWGRMSVEIDGVRRTTVDLYSSTTRRGAGVYKITGLPSARHTIKLTATGLKNSKSTSSRINVDAFDVVGASTRVKSAALYEQADGRLFWDGPWRTYTSSWYSGDSLRTATGSAAEMVAEFNGDSVALVGPRGPAYGRAEVFVDGKSQGIVSAYGPASVTRRVLWARGGLADGRHTLVVRVLGKRDSASKGTTFGVDVIEVGGSMTQSWRRAEETDTRITHAGSWTHSSNSSMSGGKYSHTTSAGGVVRVRFKGSAFRVVAPRGRSYGQIEVTCDGKSSIVSLYSSSLRVRQRVFTLGGLDAADTHEVEVRSLGTKAGSARWHTATIDAIDVRGTFSQAPDVSPFIALEEDASQIALSPSWRLARDSSASHGRIATSTSKGQTAKVRFNGTAVRLVAPKTPSSGKARIVVDGETAATVDLYSGTKENRRVVWSRSGLADAEHSVTVEALGTRNSESSGSSISIDGFHVTGDLEEPARPTDFHRIQQSDSRVIRSGYWKTTSTSAASGGSHSTSRDARGIATFKFKGTQVAWIGSRDTSYGRAHVYLDGRLVATVDNHNYATEHARVLWRAVGLSDTTHTLRIHVDDDLATGSSYWVPIDSIEIVGEPEQTTLRADQTDYHIGWSGTWSTLSRSGAYGGTVRRATRAANGTVTFVGSRVLLFSEVGPAAGKAKIAVDGGSPVTVDLYRAQRAPNTRIFEKSGLPNGSHTVVISYTGTRNPSSSSNAINVDAVATGGVLTGSTPAAKARDTIIKTAIDQLGKPYIWAADGPDSFDCSGLTMYCYAKAGMSLPHYSGAQWDLCSPKSISMSQMIPGDLAFSSRPSYIHHVGLYIGKDPITGRRMTINAPSSGRNVEYRDLDTYGCFGRIASSRWPK